MENIEYFKLQAKNLLKDYKTQLFSKEEIYDYHPKYFDVIRLFNDFKYRYFEDNFSFTLMHAQHLIAKLAGFDKWNDLLNAKPAELELAHLLFDNAHKTSIDEWNKFTKKTEKMNHKKLNAEEKLNIFKHVFIKQNWYKSNYIPYRVGLEESHYNLFYKELTGQERISVIKDHLQDGYGFDDDEIVECIHCGEKYPFKNVKVIKNIDDDIAVIVCKNHPKCNGSIIDLMHVEKQVKK
ncbi:MAG: hypothetical protein IKO95_00670 [Spirochaetia bacterium]|nr:hypothetical protein [Spirochaetia bacterium]